jgi:hypothetical protein
MKTIWAQIRATPGHATRALPPEWEPRVQHHAHDTNTHDS